MAISAGMSLGLAGLQVSQELPNGLANFHEWHRVNAKPHYIRSEFDHLCVGPTPEQRREILKNPHVWKHITVYVNPQGKKAMAERLRFPVGSVIVKEKFANMAGKLPRPELSTVMIKRERGFNPKCGDWEFAVLDAAGKKMMNRGRLESCMKCHVGQAKRDFVFGSYTN
jgi:hypothetical protein